MCVCMYICVNVYVSTASGWVQVGGDFETSDHGELSVCRKYCIVCVHVYMCMRVFVFMFKHKLCVCIFTKVSNSFMISDIFQKKPTKTVHTTW